MQALQAGGVQALQRILLGTGLTEFGGHLLGSVVTFARSAKQALPGSGVFAVLVDDHPLGCVDALGGELGVEQGSEQQIERRTLVGGRHFDDEGGIAVAGEGIPVATQGLHALFQAGFAAFVDAAEQQMFEQVWHFLVGAVELVEADADHQANRHVAALGGGFED